MLKFILKMDCSLGGCIDGPNRELDWLTPKFGAELGECLLEQYRPTSPPPLPA